MLTWTIYYLKPGNFKAVDTLMPCNFLFVSHPVCSLASKVCEWLTDDDMEAFTCFTHGPFPFSFVLLPRQVDRWMCVDGWMLSNSKYHKPASQRHSWSYIAFGVSRRVLPSTRNIPDLQGLGRFGSTASRTLTRQETRETEAKFDTNSAQQTCSSG